MKRWFALLAAVLMLMTSGCGDAQTPADDTVVTVTDAATTTASTTAATTTTMATEATTTATAPVDAVSPNAALDRTVDIYLRLAIAHDSDALDLLPDKMWELCPAGIEEYRGFMLAELTPQELPAWNYVSVCEPHDNIFEVVVICGDETFTMTVTDEGNGVMIMDEMIFWLEEQAFLM